MSSELLFIFYASPRDTGLDATLAQVTPAAGKVIALVRMQLARTFAGLAVQARHRRNCIERGFECHRVVPVGAGDRNGQGNASCAYDDVPFRPELPPVCR